MTLSELKMLFIGVGCKRLYAKKLSENDNSKNQVYFGPGFKALNLFPNNGVITDNKPKNPIFKAGLRFSWLLTNGALTEALGAQLILYPQYPEVRFSGFLKGCQYAPLELMRGRETGRILFLGVTEKDQVIGFVVAANSPITAEFCTHKIEPSAGVFHELALPHILGEADSRIKLLYELHRINNLGWVESKQLDSHGKIKPCNAPQCGGFTLEAELGIAKNSVAEPDFFGWEVKQHTVSNFDCMNTGAITLMTPEPTGGFYKENGAEAFVRKFGYPDNMGRPDRLNFGGIHKVGERHATTHLTMALTGYDIDSRRIIDANGEIVLLSDENEVAASWAFSGLLEHWSRKHTRAVYVPSKCRKEPTRQYHYGNKVRLAQGTDSLRLLHALAKAAVYYDPGIKLENASGLHPTTKRRSQFRIASKSIDILYEMVEVVEV